MTRTAVLLCVLAAAFAGCASSPPARLVLLNRATGSRHVGTVVASNREASMMASIEINGVHFNGRFGPSKEGSDVVNLLGSGGDLLHCVFHLDPRTRTGTGECAQTGARSFDATLSD